MLSIKEISEQFDISKSTLYDWKKERPKIYEYLANSDDQYEKYREVNILLESYIKTAKDIKLFDYKEVEYIFSLNLDLKDLKNIENLHLTYINKSFKIEKESNEFVLNIYKKLEKLNLIEKYIFSMRLKTVANKIKKEEKESLIKHYFKEFTSWCQELGCFRFLC